MGTGAPTTAPGGPEAELTTLVGRRADAARVRELLSAARLVTLTGVGGVGKTRLALRVAGDVARAFPDGVHLAALASLREGDLLAQSVGAAVGLANPGREGADATEALVAHLRGRRALLVLDNCEHLVDDCARLTGTLLRAAPGLRVLATSRQTLGITAEQVFPVAPLPVPDPQQPCAPREIRACPSVVLFTERAAAVMPGFTVTEANAAAVARLVHRLDGLPFAIELAAARMRTLTPAEMLDLLADRFALLSGGSRVAEPRQRTLRKLIDWSHALCTPAERTLWARVSVFRDGFDLEALRQVCADDGLPPAALVDVLGGLVEKSVVVHRQQDGRSRYGLLETVREYGYERLAASGELAASRRRHRDHYADLTARAQREWFGPRQAEWFARLRRDHANLRAALEYCAERPGETEAGLALAIAPRHYWITAGSLAEGRRWLGRLLGAGGDDGGERACNARPLALATHAYLGVLLGGTADTLRELDAAAAVAKACGDVPAAAWTRHHRAVLATWQGDADTAGRLFAEALTAFHATGRLDGAVECMVKLAIVHAYAGDAERAAVLCREVEETSAAHGESWLRGIGRFARAVLDAREGDPKAAIAAAREAIGLMRPFDDWWDIAMCVEVIAWSTVDDPARAARLLGVLRLLWGAVGGDLETAPFMRERHRAFEETVRAALPAARFERALRSGAESTVAEALAFVLDEPPAVPRARVDGRTGGPLTRRESQVAELVAEGLTNQQIATRLVIARSTAENHVERILTKLGFTSRSQLAVWTHDRRMREGRPGDGG
ncbi:LuxR C-terminal-related transcriptional regulator [Streptantibioticus parmotrematis]|uniref:ATP-binding protein n=1 Tax=Streptantibioticus parmotrematis TaxID=2873249 RepID=UPI0033F5D4AE